VNNQEAYDRGYVDGLTTYAWWKDGVEQVGTTGTTLKKAKAERKETYNYLPPKEEEDVEVFRVENAGPPDRPEGES